MGRYLAVPIMAIGGLGVIAAILRLTASEPADVTGGNPPVPESRTSPEMTNAYVADDGSWTSARSESSPEITVKISYSKVPLDERLAAKITLPMPLSALETMLGGPGSLSNSKGGQGTIEYRWYYDYYNQVSIPSRNDLAVGYGDVVVKDGQVIALWFSDGDTNLIRKNADGDFVVTNRDHRARAISAPLTPHISSSMVTSRSIDTYFANSLRLPMKITDLQKKWEAQG
jgi:hypothetical protein